MLIMRSVLYNIYLYVLTVSVAVGWLPMVILGTRETTLLGFRFWGRASLWGLEKICGTTLELRGEENLPRDRPVIIASKHHSMWDILVFYALIENPAFISKQELGWIPIAGTFLKKGGTIIVNRGAAAKALKAMVEDVRDALENKRTIIIFPEGTRSAPGAAPDYKPGIAALYTRLDHACVPVALNSGLYWPRRKFLRKPGTIVLEFLPAIEPGLSRKDFMIALQSSIETASNHLLDETKSDRASDLAG